MRKSLKPFLLGILFGIAATGAAQAAFLPTPTASYDAEVTGDIGTNHFTSTVNAVGPKERRVVDLASGKQTLLIDSAKGTIYLLVPALNTAMTLDKTSTGNFDINQLYSMPVTAEGSEIVGGEATTRYAVTGTTKQGSFTGHVWETADGIIMKVEGYAAHKDKTTPVTITLSHLNRRAQPAGIVDLPPGMKVTPFGLGALLQPGGK